MRPVVILHADGHHSNFVKLSGWVRELATLPSYFRPDEEQDYMWVMRPERWHLAPILRKELRRAEGLATWESWLQGEDTSSDGMSGLVVLFAPPLPRCKELTPRVETTVRCTSCGRRRYELPPKPHVELKLPRSRFIPGMFSVENSSVRIISGKLLAALRSEGLDAGLDVFPVEVTTPAQDEYFGIRATVDLGWAAAPYGCAKHDTPCSVCGSRYPRFAFYPTFERPAEPVDWMSSTLEGPSGLYVTTRVYEWLTGPGKHLTGKTSKGETVETWLAGWFPDDLDKAFLPERFRGESDEPVEPLQPGEFPWFER